MTPALLTLLTFYSTSVDSLLQNCTSFERIVICRMYSEQVQKVHDLLEPVVESVMKAAGHSIVASAISIKTDFD
jgi:hypothetical protein